MSNVTVFEGYDDFLRELKERIQTAQVRSSFAVSRELMALYWNIGQGLAERRAHTWWGEGALRRLALDVGGKDYYLDLLFYHLRLRCFVVVDLKIGEFTPEFAGKMNFYLSAVDELVRQPQDASSIGLILCKSRDRVTVEYALHNTTAPIGVAEFVTALPSNLVGSLPTVEQMEAELTEIAAEQGALETAGYSPTVTIGPAEGEVHREGADG